MRKYIKNDSLGIVIDCYQVCEFKLLSGEVCLRVFMEDGYKKACIGTKRYDCRVVVSLSNGEGYTTIYAGTLDECKATLEDITEYLITKREVELNGYPNEVLVLDLGGVSL